MKGGAILCALLLGWTGTAEAAPFNAVSFAFDQVGLGGLYRGRTPTQTGGPPQAATLEVDHLGNGEYNGYRTNRDTVADPFRNPEIYGHAQGRAFYGELKALAITNYAANGQSKGTFSSARAESEDIFVIEAPGIDGQPGTAEAKMLVTGGVRIFEFGSDREKTEPRFGYGVGLVQKHLDGPGFADRFIFDNETENANGNFDTNGVYSTVSFVKDSFDFIYGDKFILNSSLGAGGNVDTTFPNVNGNPQLADVEQYLEADFAATAVLSFLLPDGATLTAIGSGVSYRQAQDEVTLDSLLGWSAPTTVVPLPAAGWMLLSGLGLLATCRLRGA